MSGLPPPLPHMLSRCAEGDSTFVYHSVIKRLPAKNILQPKTMPHAHKRNSLNDAIVGPRFSGRRAIYHILRVK